MTFSVLICTRNSANKICEVINSINSQTCKTDIAEVILVTWPSPDHTLKAAVEQLQKSNIINYIFPVGESGKTTSIEYGLDKAIGNFVLILDDDNILLPDFIQKAKDILQNNNTLGCLGSKGIADESLQYPSWFDRYQPFFAIGQPKQARTSDWVWGAASIINLEAWHLLRKRGFTFQLSQPKSSHNAPIALGGEDVELALAIKLLGYTIDSSDNLRFIHKFGQERLNKEYLVAHNRGIARSVAVHEMYRGLIYNPGNDFSYMIWQFRFWKKVLSSIIHTMLSYLLAYPKIDREMNYANFIGMLSGYKRFSAKAPHIIKSLKKLLQNKSRTAILQ